MSCKVSVWFKRNLFSFFSILKRIIYIAKIYLSEYTLQNIHFSKNLYRSILKYTYLPHNRGVMMDKSEIKKEGVDSSISEFANVSPEYILLVENADKYNQDFFIDNTTFDHAKFLTFKLINRAKKFIKIFTGDLSEVYYNNNIILKALAEKLDKNVKVDIITRNGTKSKEFIELQKKYKDNLNISSLKGKTEIENHFLLVDDTSFRIELAHSKKDTSIINFKVDAKANFYNEEFGGLLRGVFDKLRI